MLISVTISLRASRIPVYNGTVVSPAREAGDFQLVPASLPTPEGPAPVGEGLVAPRVSPPGLRPTIRAPTWQKDYV